jgi:hypothetical protein
LVTPCRPAWWNSTKIRTTESMENKECLKIGW